MTLKEKLTEDLKIAMKSGDANAVGVLRLLISALNNKAIEKRGRGQTLPAGRQGDELNDEEVMQVLLTEAKKRRESMEVFTKGGRTDLADKEKSELGILQRYLPKQLGREEVEKIVNEIVEKAGTKDIGPVMKAVMAELKGRADSALVSALVKEKLK
jgi:hypothetical protein